MTEVTVKNGTPKTTRFGDLKHGDWFLRDGKMCICVYIPGAADGLMALHLQTDYGCPQWTPTNDLVTPVPRVIITTNP